MKIPRLKPGDTIANHDRYKGEGVRIFVELILEDKEIKTIVAESTGLENGSLYLIAFDSLEYYRFADTGSPINWRKATNTEMLAMASAKKLGAHVVKLTTSDKKFVEQVKREIEEEVKEHKEFVRMANEKLREKESNPHILPEEFRPRKKTFVEYFIWFVAGLAASKIISNLINFLTK